MMSYKSRAFHITGLTFCFDNCDCWLCRRERAKKKEEETKDKEKNKTIERKAAKASKRIRKKT